MPVGAGIDVDAGHMRDSRERLGRDKSRRPGSWLRAERARGRDQPTLRPARKPAGPGPPAADAEWLRRVVSGRVRLR
ncbi:hypothetical protein Slala05_55120 [Streptomyces lavendulae subsp. lavendulae]|nr:hypothetical protein Slala05_55120 [Streptomyces lavendulae subsp. lavendulae]